MSTRGGTISCLSVCSVGEREEAGRENCACLSKDLKGPKTDPAKLALSADKTIQGLFSQLFIAAIASDNSIRFLSRFDKSATNIKESAIWASIGQTPWAYPFSFFYHVDTEFPYQALATAAKLGEYTLTDRGTWYGAESWVRKEMQIYVSSFSYKREDTFSLGEIC